MVKRMQRLPLQDGAVIASIGSVAAMVGRVWLVGNRARAGLQREGE